MSFVPHPPRIATVAIGLFFVSVLAARAFFPEPNLRLVVDESGIVNVNGPPGEKGAVKVDQLSFFSVIGAPKANVSETFPNGRSGAGTVPVRFRALEAGIVRVVFTGTYKGQPVQGEVLILVKRKPHSIGSTRFAAAAADPVSTATGEFFASEGWDLHLGGPLPLYFARFYAGSLEEDGQVEAGLGRNRTHNFASRMEGSAVNRYHVILPDGVTLGFQKTGKRWTLQSPQDIAYTLTELDGFFLLGHPVSKHIWTYDANGRLVKIEDGKGSQLSLDYFAGRLISVVDPFGRELTFGYTGSKITSVSDHTGRQVSFSYTGDDLTTATDALGKVTTYNYDMDGQLLSFTRPEGNTPFTQTFDIGRVDSQTERGIDTSLLAYVGDTTTFTDPTGETIVDLYDGANRLLANTDQAGKVASMTYDAAGRRNSLTNRLGNTTHITYHAPSGLPATVTNAEGGRTSYTYKARSKNGLIFFDLIRVTQPDGSSVAYFYDKDGNVRQIIDQTQKVWRFTHNLRGQVRTVTTPLGGVFTYTYDAQGRLSTSRDPDTGDTTYGYDSRDRVTLITHPDGESIAMTYNDSNRITSVTDERGHIFSYAYDENNRLTGVTDPAGNTTALAYDTLDRVIKVTDRMNNEAERTYDSRRLLTSVKDRNALVTTAQYDQRQRPVGVTDPDGHVWTNEFDDEGLLAGFATPIDPAAKLRRNRLGRVVEASSPLGHTSYATRDAMQRVTRFSDPLGRQTVLSYEKRGLLASVSEQGTGIGKFTYDNLGNLTRIVDPNGGLWSFTYTPGGRIASETDPLGLKWTHAYDNRGRHNKVTHPDGRTLSLDYDEVGNVTRREFSGGPDLMYGYDNRNRLSSATGVTFSYDAEGRLTQCNQHGKASTATYDAEGRLLTVSYLDGSLTVTYQYNSRDLLTEVSDSLSGAQVNFAYDSAGRLTGVTRSNGVNGSHTYDAAGRLTRIQEGVIIDLQYTLDAADEVRSVNFVAPSIPMPPAGTDSFAYGRAGQLTSSGYAYDERGRLITAPSKTFGWDDGSRLTNVNGVALAYNGLNDLTQRTAGGSDIRFHTHYALGLKPIIYEEIVSGPATERAYVWTPGGRLLYSIEIGPNTPVFYHFDRVGSTLALTDTNGDVTDSYAYGPYGERWQHSGTSTQPFTFIGAFGVRQEGDLYQMRTRYYDPTTARFLSRDPLPPQLTNLKSLNPYEYAAQNPLQYVDVRGERHGRNYGGGGVPSDMGPMGAGFGEYFGLLFAGTTGDPLVDRRLLGQSGVEGVLGIGKSDNKFLEFLFTQNLPVPVAPPTPVCGSGPEVLLCGNDPPVGPRPTGNPTPEIVEADPSELESSPQPYVPLILFKPTRKPTDEELRLLPQVFVRAEDMRKWAEEDKNAPPTPPAPPPTPPKSKEEKAREKQEKEKMKAQEAERRKAVEREKARFGITPK